MSRVHACLLASSLISMTSSVGASERSFAYTHESRVLAPGESELEPWTTFRVGRDRYYSALDARLELEHGVAPHLQVALYWNFSTETRDVVVDELTGALGRTSESQFESASLEAKYQLSDPTADAIGSALYLETTLGPRESEIEARLIVDRKFDQWLFAANLAAEFELEPERGDKGSELETGLLLEPSVALSRDLGGGFAVGVELHAPLGIAGEAGGAALFGGPALRWADHQYWATLGIQPQLIAFSRQSSDSRLDLQEHERLQVRLIAGFWL